MNTISNFSYDDFLKSLDETGPSAFSDLKNPLNEYLKAKEKHQNFLKDRYRFLVESLNNQTITPEIIKEYNAIVIDCLRFIS